MQNIFYDTCALLKQNKNAFNEPFYISFTTLQELENIKTSATKDPDVKYRARKIVKLINEHCDNVRIHHKDNYDDCNSNDDKIIADALDLSKILQSAGEELIFYTEDLCCLLLAREKGLNTKYLNDRIDDEYNGIHDMIMDDSELSEFYSNVYSKGLNPYGLYINQYLRISLTKSSEKIIYRYVGGKYEEINSNKPKSEYFGKLAYKDEYQQMALDSLINNQITMIRGAAGTGKSYLSLSYLWYLLESHRIDRIIIFCNTVATIGAAKLGFYPGTRNDKLLDSQIGNFLASKMGDMEKVRQLVEDGKIVLLPLSDIRGYDTSNMKAGIYITEAQNMDIELMKLSLQRIGEDSFCVIEGDDDTQVDVAQYGGNNNGMKRLSEVFRGQDFYGEVTLQYIYRSKIARIAEMM